MYPKSTSSLLDNCLLFGGFVFSSRGKVDVTGIGENTVLPYYGGYYYMSGTSFSCPQTAGVFALMFNAFGAQTVPWLEGHLQDTCVDLGYDVTTQGI